MKSVRFTVQGFDRTWFGFYFGFGLFDSIFFLLSAAPCWFLGGLRPAEQRSLAPLTRALFVSHAAGAVLAWTYFFVAPGVFSTVIAALPGYDRPGRLHRAMAARRHVLAACGSYVLTSSLHRAPRVTCVRSL